MEAVATDWLSKRGRQSGYRVWDVREGADSSAGVSASEPRRRLGSWLRLRGRALRQLESVVSSMEVLHRGGYGVFDEELEKLGLRGNGTLQLLSPHERHKERT